jgi:DNA-binding LacI/PurR family transcriptional regulator
LNFVAKVAMAAPTLRDIAAHANVSASTVSRVLNAYPYVDQATRSHVLQVARDLGYPNLPSSQEPIANRAVLLLMRDYASGEGSENPAGRDFERTVTSSVQAIFAQHGITTRLQHTLMEESEVASYREDPSVAGLILLGGRLKPSFIKALQDAQVPFVIAGGHALPLRTNCVLADVSRATEEAISHLVSRGRRAIGLVNGPEDTATSAERMRGYRLGLADHDLPVIAERITRADFRADAGFSATVQLLDACPDLDAILYPDDLVAMGGMRAIKASGRRVPDDVAVVGFYDYDLAQYTDPPMTSLQVDMQQIGDIAARRLELMIDSKDHQDWMVFVESSLQVRDSS